MIQWRLRVEPVRHQLLWRRWTYVCEGWYVGHHRPAFTREAGQLFATEQLARAAGAQQVTQLSEQDVRRQLRRPPEQL